MTTEPTPTPPPSAPRRNTGPGVSEGQLSPEFPEIAIHVSASFAHDHGMMSTLESLSVGGEACTAREVLERLVALRKGWTRAGGSSDADAVATVTAFVEAWSKIFEFSGRLTEAKGPEGLEGAEYHPPRFALYDLDNGDKIVVHSFFQTWDGGNHGRQFAYCTEAYQVSNGAYFELQLPVARFGRAAPPMPAGPQPVDPKVPRPRNLRGW